MAILGYGGKGSFLVKNGKSVLIFFVEKNAFFVFIELKIFVKNK